MNLYHYLERKKGDKYSGKLGGINEDIPISFLETILYDIVIKNNIGKYTEYFNEEELTIYNTDMQLSGKYVSYILSIDSKIVSQKENKKRKLSEITDHYCNAESDDDNENYFLTEYVDNNKGVGYVSYYSKHSKYYSDKVFPLTMVNRLWNYFRNLNTRVLPKRLTDYVDYHLTHDNMVNLCDLICYKRENNHNYTVSLSLKITEQPKRCEIREIVGIIDSMKELKKNILKMEGRLMTNKQAIK